MPSPTGPDSTSTPVGATRTSGTCQAQLGGAMMASARSRPTFSALTSKASTGVMSHTS